MDATAGSANSRGIRKRKPPAKLQDYDQAPAAKKGPTKQASAKKSTAKQAAARGASAAKGRPFLDAQKQKDLQKDRDKPFMVLADALGAMTPNGAAKALLAMPPAALPWAWHPIVRCHGCQHYVSFCWWHG